MNQPTRSRRSAGAVLLEFLGSMNLAITLLVAICIAAAIGTVLQQNQSYADYVAKFGPFWFEVFKALGLYDIYGTAWFLVLLGLLLVSTTVCIGRNAPAMLRDMRHFRFDVQEKSLRGFHHVEEWRAADGAEPLARAAAVLSANGYTVRRKDHGDRVVLAAMKGSWNRLGYLLTHAGIVVICIGALVDSNLPLRVAEQMGRIKLETRDIPASQVPAESTLPTGNSAFRGSVRVPEGGTADFVFLNVRDGYLLQKLPFTIELKQFRIQHYPSGMPKSFESDVVIHDPAAAEPVTRTISVNHPLVYKGYAIYQSSFSDGGSHLALRAWSLDAPDLKPIDLAGNIYEGLSVITPRGPFTIELNDFKPINVQPAEEGSGRKIQNYGPSVVFKLRNKAGEALEYVNYLAPVNLRDRVYYVSGVRSSPAEEFRYVYFPLDAKGGLDRFMQLRARLLDEKAVRRVVAAQAHSMVGDNNAAKKKELADSVVMLTSVFARGGMDGVMARMERIPAAERENAMKSYVMVLQSVLGGLYLDQLKSEGIAVEKGVGEADARFFDDTLEAFAGMGVYGSPLFIQFTDFQQVQASGFEVTRAPGQTVVYLGCVMLMAGVFFMFYLHHRRVWVSVKAEEGSHTVLLAGSGNRDRTEFGREFQSLSARIKPVQPGGEGHGA
jgi:cytochrome c biogenesis protein